MQSYSVFRHTSTATSYSEGLADIHESLVFYDVLKQHRDLTEEK